MSLDFEPNPNRPTDEHLLTLIANQDMGAYEVLYDRHARTIYSLILRIVKSPEVAEDLLQDVFWQIWRDARQYDGGGAATAWMFRIGRNRGLDELRRRKSRPRADEQTDVESAYRAASREQPSAESEAEEGLNRQRIVSVLGDLPPDQRSCVELAYFVGLSHREISERLNVPVGTVKSRLRIGLEKLERGLRKAGFP